MEPIVPSRPGATELLILFEHQDVDSPARKRGRGRQARRSPADHDHRRFRHF
jgi:hypothetical protein